MRINRLDYRIAETGWQLRGVDFSQLSLFVGLSGAGKTRILKSLHSLALIAAGASVDGANWELRFEIDGVDHKWTGEFEALGYCFHDIIIKGATERTNTVKRPKLLSESITVGGQIVAMRDGDIVLFNGERIPKVSPDESLLKILSEEDLINPISEGFKDIHFLNANLHGPFEAFGYADTEEVDEVFESDDEIKSSTLSLPQKISVAYRNKSPLFDELRSRFIDIFPFVTDIKMEPLSGEDVPRWLRDERLLQIKENDVDIWISMFDMSSGMMKSIVHLAQVLFSRPGSVFLIDEFENSLGANCVDLITDFLVEATSSAQFILTSHHPYVVNHIPPEHWSVVSRKGPKIDVEKAEMLGIGESMHENYAQLINNLLYRPT